MLTSGDGPKPVPVIVTPVPPAAGPSAGSTDAIVGGATKVNPPASVADPPGPDTTTSTGPAACAGVDAVSCVPSASTTTVVASAPPKVTEGVAPKPAPSMVTAVPPEVDPDAGASPVTVGGAGVAGTKVNPSASVVDPPGPDTTTSTAPAACAGVDAVSCVPSAFTTTFDAATPSNDTDGAAPNPLPAIVTDVPPATGPEDGDTDDTTGAAGTAVTKVNPSASVVDPPGPDTTTSTAPAACAGVEAVSCVPSAFSTTSDAATPSNDTDGAAPKPLPAIVTAVPPATGPDDGDTDDTIGGATYVNPSASVVDPPGPLTTTSTGPATCGGVIAVSWVPSAFTTTSDAAVPRNVTLGAAPKPVPVMVTEVPPLSGPDGGDTDDTTGGAT